MPRQYMASPPLPRSARPTGSQPDGHGRTWDAGRGRKDGVRGTWYAGYKPAFYTVGRQWWAIHSLACFDSRLPDLLTLDSLHTPSPFQAFAVEAGRSLP